jgi:hypothetical protein
LPLAFGEGRGTLGPNALKKRAYIREEPEERTPVAHLPRECCSFS